VYTVDYMNDTQFPIEKPWYTTGGGIAFLGVLGVILLGMFIFGGFVAYYAYQIRQGNGPDIAKHIQGSKNFSTITGSDTGTVTKATDPTPFIRPFNPQFGNLDSKITIIAFIDFECPYSQESFPIFESVRERYEPAVHFVFKQFPLTSIHPLAIKAGLAGACANAQDTFWPYYSRLFTTKNLSNDALLSSADQLGLNRMIFDTCLSSRQFERNVNQDIQDGLALGVRGTPTYFIGSTKLEGVVPEEVWDSVILSAIQSQ